MSSKILNPDRMKQLIDFRGLELDGGIYPTDIDGLIEYHDNEYIIIEVKHGKAKVPVGQRVAMQRMVEDFTKIGKRAVAIVCEHNVSEGVLLWRRAQMAPAGQTHDRSRNGQELCEILKVKGGKKCR